MFDVVIIGTGVVGGMIARELSKYKICVCVVEKENDVCLGSSKANSAIVHAGFDAKEGTLKALLNVRGSKKMSEAAKELGVAYKRNGALVIGFSESDRFEIEKLYARGIKNGVSELKILGREEIVSLEKNVSDNAICALYAPDSAIISPYELTVAAIGNAMDNGADLKTDFEVVKIDKTGKGWRLYSQKDFIDTKCIINTAGINTE